ncbi:MAG: cation diffusion facilitator family transporter [Cyanobium sp.]
MSQGQSPARPSPRPPRRPPRRQPFRQCLSLEHRSQHRPDGPVAGDRLRLRLAGADRRRPPQPRRCDRPGARPRADRLSRRPARGRFTYGYGRSTQMTSLINGLLIFAAGAVVVVEAIQRLFNPVPLIAGPVAWAAAAGIAVNLLSARLFGRNHHHDLNQRAAVLHLLTDAAVSVAVLVSALVVGATGWLWLDAVTAIGVGAAVIGSAWGLLREAIALNLDAAPRHVDLGRVERTLAALPGVREVEELHVWGLSTSRTALTAHVLIDPDRLQGADLDRDQLLELARARLAELGIRKSTLQFENAGTLTAATPSPPLRQKPRGAAR